LCGVSDIVDGHVQLNSGRSTINTVRDVAVMHKFPLFWALCPQKGEWPEMGDIVGGISGTKDRHVRVNFGCCAINALTVTHKFPFSGGLCPQGRGSGPSWGHIGRRNWYYGLADMFG